ncbi:hypothetical protein HBB16_17780 [Pseudonocardia sp. MCCB 268]|nr:hypothetical protein [Pseudonocardia cytotoxica]
MVATPPADLYWAPERLVAHLTSNRAGLRAGDLLGSGRSPGRNATSSARCWNVWNGRHPVVLSSGGHRTWLEDGDENRDHRDRASADGSRFSLGEVPGPRPRLVSG